jgi:beta-glucosidase-like glycosyl hydrolase
MTGQTLKAAAAQCVMVRLGSNLPPGTPAGDDIERVEALLARCPVGGVLLFNARWPDVTDTLASVQRAAQEAGAPPLLVAADVERGVGQQVHGATLFPHAMAVGAVPDPASAAAGLARVTAREAQTCGIHLAFAPVADVNVEPRNPIINTRAFAGDAETVGECVEAYVRTARSEGLLTTAKHFPGHGRTATDSHATLPVVEATRDALEATDLPPFRRAIAQDVDAVMTAHVAYPRLEASVQATAGRGDAPHRPATASPAILKTLLRETYGFEGAVVSDSLLMEGIREDAAGDAEGGDPGRQAARLLAAGVDVLVDPDDPEAVVDGIVAAVEEGRLDAERVQEASRRMQAVKERVRDAWGEAAFAPSVQSAVDASVGHAAHRQAAARIARNALRVDGDPLVWQRGEGEAGRTVVLHVRPTAPDAPSPFEQGVRCYLEDAQFHTVGPGTTEAERQDLRDAALEADRLLVACVAEPAAWTDFGLAGAQEEFVRSLAAERPLAIAALGSPTVLDPILTPLPDTAIARCLRLTTHSTVPDAQKALVDWMRGG